MLVELPDLLVAVTRVQLAQHLLLAHRDAGHGQAEAKGLRGGAELLRVVGVMVGHGQLVQLRGAGRGCLGQLLQLAGRGEDVHGLGLRLEGGRGGVKVVMLGLRPHAQQLLRQRRRGGRSGQLLRAHLQGHGGAQARRGTTPGVQHVGGSWVAVQGQELVLLVLLHELDHDTLCECGVVGEGRAGLVG